MPVLMNYLLYHLSILSLIATNIPATIIYRNKNYAETELGNDGHLKLHLGAPDITRRF